MDYFVNLTNGLDWMPLVEEPFFIRISSTDIERQAWNRIYLNLDANLLMRLALGRECMILDCGTRRAVGKVIYEGVPRIKEMLERLWLRQENFPAPTQELRDVKRKLMYFHRFLNTDAIRLQGRSFATEMDGKRDHYKKIAVDWNNDA